MHSPIAVTLDCIRVWRRTRLPSVMHSHSTGRDETSDRVSVTRCISVRADGLIVNCHEDRVLPRAPAVKN